MTKTPLREETGANKTNNNCMFISDNGVIAGACAEVQKNAREEIIKCGKSRQDALFRAASSELNKASDNIVSLVESNRGGASGVHGFIAEQLEVGIGNANSIMDGNGIRFSLIDDNGRDDLLIDASPVQMKFVQKAMSLDAVKEHMTKYPDAVENGEIYMIPKDYWEKLQQLWKVHKEEAGKLKNTDYTLWKKLHSLSEDGLCKDRLCAAEFNYDDVQKETYQDTIEDCRKSVIQKREDAIMEIVEENAPTITEALKTMAIGAGIEGILNGVFTVYDKHRNGIDVIDYKVDDATDVVKAVGKGAINGGLRSGLVYVFVNFTPILPGIVSGAYTLVEKIIEIRSRTDDTEESKEKAKQEMIAVFVDVVLSTVLSMIGAKCLKKNRVLGTVIGSMAAKMIIFVWKSLYPLSAESLPEENTCA